MNKTNHQFNGKYFGVLTQTLPNVIFQQVQRVRTEREFKIDSVLNSEFCIFKQLLITMMSLD